MNTSVYFKEKIKNKVTSTLIANGIIHKLYNHKFLVHWTKLRGGKKDTEIDCKSDLRKFTTFFTQKIKVLERNEIKNWLDKLLKNLYHLLEIWKFDKNGDDIIKRDLKCILGEIFIREKMDEWLKELPPKLTKIKLYPHIKDNYDFWIVVLRTHRGKIDHGVVLYSEKVECLKNMIKKQISILRECKCN